MMMKYRKDTRGERVTIFSLNRLWLRSFLCGLLLLRWPTLAGYGRPQCACVSFYRALWASPLQFPAGVGDPGLPPSPCLPPPSTYQQALVVGREHQRRLLLVFHCLAESLPSKLAPVQIHCSVPSKVEETQAFLPSPVVRSQAVPLYVFSLHLAAPQFTLLYVTEKKRSASPLSSCPKGE